MQLAPIQTPQKQKLPQHNTTPLKKQLYKQKHFTTKTKMTTFDLPTNKRELNVTPPSKNNRQKKMKNNNNNNEKNKRQSVIVQKNGKNFS